MKTSFIYHIDESICINCGSCRRFCPVDTIHYTSLQHQIEMSGCIGCTICFAVCPVDAITVTEEALLGHPVDLDPADMERVRRRAWVKGPFYQQKRRQTGLVARKHEMEKRQKRSL
jgi:ferredoxin